MEEFSRVDRTSRVGVAAARAAAALIGFRVAAGGIGGGANPPADAEPPEWLADLDDHEGLDEIWYALYGPLDYMLEARIAPGDPHTCGHRSWRAGHFARRGGCPRTTL
jgi:hypothetical protein